MSAIGAGKRPCQTAIQQSGRTKSYQSFSVDRGNLPVVLSDTTIVDEPPDGGYGWVCVACVFLLNAHTWGINSSYGVFLAHYLATNTFPGASYLEYAFVGGLSISQALLVSPIATTVTRLYGTRTTLLIGVFLETLSLVGASFATKVWHLFLTQGICFGWGMGFQFVGSVAIVPQWFKKRRSVANGIATGGSGFGGLTYSLATTAMIQSIGLSWAFRTLAIVQFVVNFGCAMLLKDRNKQIGTNNATFNYRLFRKMQFWLILGWGIFSMLGYVILLFSIADYARSVGLDAKQASVISALLNLSQGLGRPVVGCFSDAAGRINMAGLLTFLTGLFCVVLWIFAKTYGVLIFFALLIGGMCGTFWTTIAPVGVEVLGLKDVASGLSIVWLVLVLPTTFAEPLGLKLRQMHGDIYLHAQIFTGVMYICAAICLCFLRAWKVGELERSEQEKKVERDESAAPVSINCQVSRMEPANVTSSLWRRLTIPKRV